MKKTLGERISELRKNKNMTQEDLAIKMGVSPQAVSKWENDVSCPDINTLPKLAKILDISVDRLLSDEEPADTYIVPVEERKDINKMLLKIRVSSEGDKVKLNLPLSIVKIALEMGSINGMFGKNCGEVMKEIDFNSIFAMAEQGVMGKILEVESDDGDIVEIFVE